MFKVHIGGTGGTKPESDSPDGELSTTSTDGEVGDNELPWQGIDLDKLFDEGFFDDSDFPPFCSTKKPQVHGSTKSGPGKSGSDC